MINAFKPPVLLKSPHLQTILSSAGPRAPAVQKAAANISAAARLITVPCEHGVRLHALYNEAPNAQALIVLIHGWEGSAESLYQLSAARRLVEAGYSVLRLNLRDHGDSHHLNEDLFHSCRLQEVVDAVAWAAASFKPERLLLGGFSLGGNFALRVAAQAPEAGIQLDRVLAVCPVLDPEETMHALDGGLSIYQWFFLRKWRRSLLKKMNVFPDRYEFDDLHRFKTLEAMTEFFVVNHTEYPDLHSYLKGYSLEGGRLSNLSVRSHVLLAEDDPVIPVAGLERVARPDCLDVEVTRFGGHCGHLQNYRLESWADAWLLDKAGGD